MVAITGMVAQFLACRAYEENWVAVKDFRLNYHNGYILLNNRASPNIVTEGKLLNSKPEGRIGARGSMGILRATSGLGLGGYMGIQDI